MLDDGAGCLGPDDRHELFPGGPTDVGHAAEVLEQRAPSLWTDARHDVKF